MRENPNRIGSILRLDDWNVKAVIREHLDDKKVLARGTFSALFPGSEAGWLWKLTVDPMSHEIAFGPYAFDGPYALRARNDQGEVGGTSDSNSIYLYEVEGLVPLTGSEKASWRKLQNFYDDRYRDHMPPFGTLNRDSYRGQASHNALVDAAATVADPALKDFLGDQLANFVINFDAGTDFHSANVMKRPAGHAVFSDPVYDLRLLAEFQAQQRKKAEAARKW